MDPRQLRDLIVIPTLRYLEPEIPFSEAAVNLLMGTAAHESDGFQYIKQLGGGPALGLWQMEPRTHDDIWENYLAFHADLRARVETLIGLWPNTRSEHLQTNLAYACAMSRVFYFRLPNSLPEADDLDSLAVFWKSHYNTWKGKGTPAQFIRSYLKHVNPLTEV